MNKQGKYFMAWFTVALLVVLTVFSMIEPLKDNLDSVRGGDSLNCPGVSNFNQTSYDEQNSFEKLVYRPVCFTTGLSMVYFVGSVLIGVVLWVWRNK